MDSRIVKRKFLLSTAVLLAGVSLASAQGMREGTGPGGGGEHGISSGASGGRSAESEMSRGSSGAQRDERMQSQTRGQGMREGGQGLREGGRAEGQSERQIDRDQTQRGQAQETRKGQQDQTVGQGRDATLDQGKRDSDRARRSEGERRDAPGGAQTRQTQEQQRQDRTKDRTGATTQGQSKTGAESKTGAQNKSGAESQRQSGTQSLQQQDRAGAATQGQSATGAATQSQTGATAQTQANRTTLSTQQQATIRQSVLSATNTPRVNVNSINFAVNVGVPVPSHVNVVSVSTFPALIDVFPTYRDYSFFVVEDEIVFLDRDRRVVEVVPAGPRARFSRSSAGTGAMAKLDLSEAEIRQVQQVLIERGLLTGEADGVLGSRTRAALVTFQRQQGIQSTGSIDTHTVDALGLSSRISQRTGQSTTGSSQPSTVGQSQTGTAQQQQPSAQQNTQAPAQQNTIGQAAPQSQSTVGQAGHQPAANPNMPSGGPTPSTSTPETSGQVTSGEGSAPAQNPGENPAEK